MVDIETYFRLALEIIGKCILSFPDHPAISMRDAAGRGMCGTWCIAVNRRVSYLLENCLPSENDNRNFWYVVFGSCLCIVPLNKHSQKVTNWSTYQVREYRTSLYI